MNCFNPPNTRPARKRHEQVHVAAATRVCLRIFRLLLVLALVLVGGVARAEQFRVAVMAPELSAETSAPAQAAGIGALWQSLVTTELARRDLFAVVERDELATLGREFDWSRPAAGVRQIRPRWLGADWVLIGRLTITNGQCRLALKLLDAAQGAVEREFNPVFAADAVTTAARTLGDELQALGLQQLSARDIHTLVAVHDYEVQSPFEYNRWRERALARRLRAVLQQQPGVLVLEREAVEALLAEVRLRRGGLTAAGAGDTNRWANLRHYQLVTGTITETQPEGKPLTLRVNTRLRDLANGGGAEFAESFPADEWANGVGRIEQQLRTALVKGSGSEGPATNGGADRSAEAAELFARALKLTGVWEFATPETFRGFCPQGMVGESQLRIAFGDSRIPMRGVPVRRARILQAAQYLKAAVLADDRDPRVKLLLASLLVDLDVNERELAVQLAEEVGWQFPEYRFTAWAHVYMYGSGDLQARYLQLLIQHFPDSRFANVPGDTELAAFLEQHRHDADLSAVVEALRPQLLREVRETPGHSVEGAVRRLFEYTQIMGGNPPKRAKGGELQSAENRARGAALLEDLMARYPDKAFYLAHFWSYYWDDYTDSDADICYWYQRAAEAAPVDPKDRWNMSVWWDKPRIGLARRLMARGEFAAAIPYLERITNGHLEGERDLRLGRCAFETGDHERALKLFRAFGPEHKEAVEWAAKCEQKVGLPPLAVPTKPYRTTTNRVSWTVAALAFPQVKGFALTTGRTGFAEFARNKFGGRTEIPQPLGDIWSMAVDAEDVWLGLVCPIVWSDHNLLMLEREPDRQANALRQGGLLRWNRASGQTHYYSVEDGLPHPWVSALADSPQGLWVGTLGGGTGLLDKRTGQWRVWTATNGLPMNSVRSLHVSGDNVWAGFGSLERGAVASYSVGTGQWRVMLPGDFPARTNLPPPSVLNAPGLPEYLKQPQVISHVPVSSVSALALVQDRLWCALPGERRGPSNERFQPRGTVLYDLQMNNWSTVSSMTAGGFIRCKDRVWMPVGGGLGNCALNGSDWQVITRADGLPLDPAAVCEWNGRVLLVGESLAVLVPGEKRFVVYPFPSAGAAKKMVVHDDQLLILQGDQMLSLRLTEQTFAPQTNN